MEKCDWDINHVVDYLLIVIIILPLRFAPLELEFTIVSDGNEPIVVPYGYGTTQTDKNGYYFQDGNTSTSWEINNVIIRAEVITLDNTVDNNITKHLLEGQSLKLIVPQYHTITQTVQHWRR